MARIERYGPVLDPTIELVKELAGAGTAELRVPMHPDAAGMAADVHYLISQLYPFTDCKIYLPEERRPLCLDSSKDDAAERILINIIFENSGFEVHGAERFSSYPHDTILNVREEDRHKAVEKHRVSVTAKSMMKANMRYGAERFLKNKIRLPYEAKQICMSFSYQSISGFAVGTSFQSFMPVGEFERPSDGEKRLYYPVSEKQEHSLGIAAWEFFMQPVFWDSWSQYSSIALHKMIGEMDYKAAKERFKDKNDAIMRHVSLAEVSVVKIIDAIQCAKSLRDVAYSVNCPHEYIGIYMEKILKTIRYFCNPDSLNDPTKKAYLENLSRACAEYGFRVTPQELANLPDTRRQVAL